MPPPSARAQQPDEPQTGFTFSCVRDIGPAGSARLRLAGALDLVNAERAHAEIRRAQDETSRLICDLAGVRFVDISGLRMLLDAAARAKLDGGRLTLVNCPPIVPRMLRLLRLEGALEVQTAPRCAAPPAFRCGQVRRHVS